MHAIFSLDLPAAIRLLVMLIVVAENTRDSHCADPYYAEPAMVFPVSYVSTYAFNRIAFSINDENILISDIDAVRSCNSATGSRISSMQVENRKELFPAAPEIRTSIASTKEGAVVSFSGGLAWIDQNANVILQPKATEPWVYTLPFRELSNITQNDTNALLLNTFDHNNRSVRYLTTRIPFSAIHYDNSSGLIASGSFGSLHVWKSCLQDKVATLWLDAKPGLEEVSIEGKLRLEMDGVISKYDVEKSISWWPQKYTTSDRLCSRVSIANRGSHVAGIFGRRMIVWDLLSKAVVSNTDGCCDMCVIGDGSRLCVVFNDNTIAIQDILDPKRVKYFKLPRGNDRSRLLHVVENAQKMKLLYLRNIAFPLLHTEAKKWYIHGLEHYPMENVRLTCVFHTMGSKLQFYGKVENVLFVRYFQLSLCCASERPVPKLDRAKNATCDCQKSSTDRG